MSRKYKEREGPFCGAKKHDGSACRNNAGHGTNHVGTGRCKFHGGASTGPKDREARKGNKFALKHGYYETITLENLEPEEKEKIAREDITSRPMLLNSIKLVLIREARMMKRINDLANATGGMILSSMEMKEGRENGAVSELKTTRYESVIEKIQGWESQLTQVQREKTRLIEKLYQLEVSETGNDGTLAEFVRQMDQIMKKDPDAE
jgi:uncharacterized protein YjcR